MEDKEHMEPPPFLASVIAFVCAEDADIKAEVERLIQFYGGACLPAYDRTTCTHVVAAATSLEDCTCQLAVKDGKTIYSDLWLKSCIQEGQVLPLRDALHRPPVSSSGIPGAEGMVLCLTGFTGETRKELQFMAELIGAEFSKPLKVFHVTHLVCYDFTGDKYEVAKARGIHIVNKYWLQDCYLNWSLRPEVEYARSTKEVDQEERARQKEGPSTRNSQETRRAQVGGPALVATESSHPTGDPESGARAGVLVRPGGTDSVSRGQGQEAEIPHGAVARATDGLGPGLTAPAPSQGPDDTAKEGDIQRTNRSAAKQEGARRTPGLAAVSGQAGQVQATEVVGGGCESVSADRLPSRVLEEMNKNCPVPELLTGGVKAVKAIGARAKVEEGARSGSSAERPCDGQATKASQEIEPGTTVARPASPSEGAEPGAVAGGDALGRQPLGGTGSGALRAEEHEAPLSTFETACENLPTQASEDTPDACMPGAGSGACPREMSPIPASPDMGKIKAWCQSPPSAADAGEDAGRAETGRNSEECGDKGAADIEARGSQGAERPSEGVSGPRGRAEERRQPAEVIVEITAAEGEGCPVAQDATDLPSAPSSRTKGNVPSAPSSRTKGNGSKGKQKNARKGAQPARASKRGTAGQRRRAQGVLEPSAVGGPFEYLGTQEQSSNQHDQQPKRRKFAQRTDSPSHLSSALELGSPSHLSSALELGSPACEPELGSPAPSPAPVETPAAQDNRQPQGPGPSTKSGTQGKGRRGRPPKKQQSEDPAPATDEAMQAQEDPVSAGEERALSGSSPAKAPGVSTRKLLPGRNSAPGRNAAPGKNPAPSRGRGRPTPGASRKKGPQGQEEEQVRRFTFGGLSGDREREALKKLALRLGAKVSGSSQAVDEKQWDKQVTHLLLGAPLKRTEKLLGATAAGRWVLRPEFLKDSAARGGFLDEAEYEWAGVGLNEDGTFDLAAPKHWRDMQAKTGMRAFQGLHVGLLDSVGPHLGVLERTISGAGGTVHVISSSSKAANPALARKIQFLVMPADEPATQNKQVGAQWKELGVPCVAPQYFVDYIAKPWDSLDAHVLQGTHDAASAALCALRERLARGLAEAESEVRVSGAQEDNSTCDGSVSEGESLDLGGSGGGAQEATTEE